MASKRNAWRAAERDAAGRGWTVTVGRHETWRCGCGFKVFCSHTPKDPDAALRAHLRLVSRHEHSCARHAA